VPVRVDQAGKDRLALEIDACGGGRHRRRGRTDGRDLPAADDDDAVFDRAAGAVDNAAADKGGGLGLGADAQGEDSNQNHDSHGAVAYQNAVRHPAVSAALGYHLR
jgi:hypothetical protein